MDPKSGRKKTPAKRVRKARPRSSLLSAVVLDEDTIEIVLGLHCFFQDASKVNFWLHITNPMLGDVKPIDMINGGRGKKLLKWIESCLDGNEAI